MKEDHHGIHTPLPSNRKSKSINPASKKLHQQQHKNIKLNLNSVFTPITEGAVVVDVPEKESIEKTSSIPTAIETDQSTVDINKAKLNSDDSQVSDKSVAVQHPEESVKISPISEAFVFHEDQSSIESYIASLNQHISPSPTWSVATTPLSTTFATTPSSSTTTYTSTATDPATFLSSLTNDGATTPETKSIMLESLTKHLRESMFQVLLSSDIDPIHKKLLDTLVKMVTEEFCSLHEERGLVVKLFSKKVKLLLLSYLLGMLLVSAGFFLLSDVQGSFQGPPPT